VGGLVAQVMDVVVLTHGVGEPAAAGNEPDGFDS
jgi:hypothetical protein